MPLIHRFLCLPLCLLLFLAAAGHCLAAKKKPQPARQYATLLLANKSSQDLIAIRILNGAGAGYARLDLAPGDADELENPGGVSDISIDLGLTLAWWNGITLDGVAGLTLCGEHADCLIVTGDTDMPVHARGQSRSLLPPEKSKPVCSLDNFHAGMTMRDVCDLLQNYSTVEEDVILASMGFASIVWSARLYASTDGAATPADAQLESVELRQRLTDKNVTAVLKALKKLHYVPWQAAFPGIELTFMEMTAYREADRENILAQCLKAFRSQNRGAAIVQFVPGTLMQALSQMRLPDTSTQILTLTMHPETGSIALDLSAYVFEEQPPQTF